MVVYLKLILIMTEITKLWNGNVVRIRPEDRYVCLTDLAKASGKFLADWKKLKGTKTFLRELSSDMNILITELVQVKQGGNDKEDQGTWGHPEVAIDFAKWCNVKLRIWVNRQINELLTTGSVSIVKPKTALELAKEQVKLLERIELQNEQIKILEDDNQRQAEIIDELFDHSSILRVAKYNNCSETAFSWHRLKAASKVLNLEVKKAPCPRFTTKNLYHHDAWRYVYPNYQLPETTTLRISSQGEFL